MIAFSVFLFFSFIAESLTKKYSASLTKIKMILSSDIYPFDNNFFSTSWFYLVFLLSPKIETAT